MSLFRKVAGLALGLALLGTIALAQNNDTPLGDVARQQSGQKATKTFDEDNFQPSTPPPPAADVKSSDSAKPDASAQGDTKSGDKADAAPSDDVKALEKQLADLKQRRDMITKQIAGLQVNIQSSEGDIRDSLTEAQGAYKGQLAKVNDEIPVVEKKLEAARAAQPNSGNAGGDDDKSKSADSKPDENPPPKSQ